MIYGLLILIVSFIWLLYETKFLTIHLYYGKGWQPETVEKISPLVYAKVLVESALNYMGSVRSSKE